MKANDQIEVMQGLRQGAAAWLIGLSARKLRDRTDAPRNKDGTYNAQELLAYLKRKTDRVTSDVQGEFTSPVDELNILRAQKMRQDMAVGDRLLLPRDLIREHIVSLASHVRKAGEQLQLQFGPEAQVIVDEALDEFERELSTGPLSEFGT